MINAFTLNQCFSNTEAHPQGGARHSQGGGACLISGNMLFIFVAYLQQFYRQMILFIVARGGTRCLLLPREGMTEND